MVHSSKSRSQLQNCHLKHLRQPLTRKADHGLHFRTGLHSTGPIIITSDFNLQQTIFTWVWTSGLRLSSSMNPNMVKPKMNLLQMGTHLRAYTKFPGVMPRNSTQQSTLFLQGESVGNHTNFPTMDRNHPHHHAGWKKCTTSIHGMSWLYSSNSFLQRNLTTSSSIHHLKTLTRKEIRSIPISCQLIGQIAKQCVLIP